MLDFKEAPKQFRPYVEDAWNQVQKQITDNVDPNGLYDCTIPFEGGTAFVDYRVREIEFGYSYQGKWQSWLHFLSSNVTQEIEGV